MGTLLPCGLTEVLPGDTVQHTTSALIRCSPLLAPVMHPCHATISHWFVPLRLIWVDFEKFITGGPDGNDASVYPTIDMGGGGAAVGSLADYLGVPTTVANLIVSALPFRAYNLIWNEFYRDQDLETALALSTASGADVTTADTLQSCDWEKDYFTTARPWTQKGSDVSMPLAGTAPINRVSNAAAWKLYREGTDTLEIDANNLRNEATSGELSNDDYSVDYSMDPLSGLTADLSGATGPDINEVREAFALQRFKEARARFGSRYTEYLRYLGVKSSDGRLDRPEPLASGRQTIQFSEVLQTGVTTDGATAGVGNLHGHGIAAMRSNRYRRHFNEHGYIISMINVKPKTMYVQGLPRTWNRRTKDDFFQKELQHIGQQEIKNKELYAAHASPDATFGYQDRYDEYRRTESTVAGDFRTTLSHWHLARIFAGDPTLNASFVKANPATRVFASAAADTLWMMTNHSMQARRLLAPIATPTIR